MQKFLRILLIICLFFICLIFGAKWADVTLIENQNVVINPDSQENYQKKILIFIVDELKKKNPELSAVWSVVIYYQDARGIMFLPLSSEKTENFKEIKRSFVITSDQDLHQKSLKFMNTKFNTKWDAYIVMDNTSENYFIDWITTYSNSDTSGNSIDANNTIENLCSLISSDQLNSFDSIVWSSLIPEHFKSNLSKEEMIDLWEILKDNHPVLCEEIK